MLRFDGRVAIVTGAGRGLGREYALLLAKRGAKVVVNDLGQVRGWIQPGKAVRTEPVAEEVVAEIRAAGGEAMANGDSVADGDRIVQAALDAYGRVDVVVCNAGIAHASPFHEVPADQWEQQMAVHVAGSFAVCKAAWPHMRKQRYGRVVLTSSPAGLYGLHQTAPYSAAKAALIGLANVLTLEGFSRGIAVNTVAPYAATRLTTGSFTKEQLSDPAKAVPLGPISSHDLGMMKPAFVAGLVAYLCHEECPERGGIYEAGAGWYSKVRLQRSRGVCLAEPGEDLPERVRDSWAALGDFADAENVGPGRTADPINRVKASLAGRAAGGATSKL